MADSLDKISYYKLLGVPKDASRDEIIRRFRAFGLRYHPDRYAGGDPETVERANRIFRRGSEAFQVLTQPAARALYDRALAQGILRLTADQRDRAAHKLKPPKKKAKADFASVEAQQLYQGAVAAMRLKDFRTAWRNVTEAYDLEPANPKIKETLEAVEDALRKGS